MTMKQFFNVIIGLVIPFIGITGGIILFRHSEFFVLGFPILYFWMFLWFILASICISFSWYFFDRKEYG
ncbi:DUF3311 domain-containing protein [Viridibacillus arvi]|uniref:DUF3311 domain-containing protein n=1 Tax=Viridibacillus arvi TaxID=263475 RepID=UPI003CFBEE9B